MNSQQTPVQFSEVEIGQQEQEPFDNGEGPVGWSQDRLSNTSEEQSLTDTEHQMDRREQMYSSEDEVEESCTGTSQEEADSEDEVEETCTGTSQDEADSSGTSTERGEGQRDSESSSEKDANEVSEELVSKKRPKKKTMLCVKIPTPPRDLKRIIAQNASKRGSSLSEDSQERDDFDNGPTHIDQSVRQNYKDYDVDMGITISTGGDQMAVGAETLRASIPSASVQRRFNGSQIKRKEPPPGQINDIDREASHNKRRFVEVDHSEKLREQLEKERRRNLAEQKEREDATNQRVRELETEIKKKGAAARKQVRSLEDQLNTVQADRENETQKSSRKSQEERDAMKRRVSELEEELKANEVATKRKVRSLEHQLEVARVARQNEVQEALRKSREEIQQAHKRFETLQAEQNEMKRELEKLQAQRDSEISAAMRRQEEMSAQNEHADFARRLTAHAISQPTRKKKTLRAYREPSRHPSIERSGDGEAATKERSSVATVTPDDISKIMRTVLQEVGLTGPGISRARPRRRMKEKETVTETNDSRNQQLAFARKVFNNVLRISTAQEFVDHRTASLQEVHDFFNSRGPGPKLDDLRFDMIGPHDNGWNKKVIDLLTEEFVRRRDTPEQITNIPLPKHPKEYIQRMFIERFRHCRKYWKEARPRQNENPEAVQHRVIERRKAELKAQRRDTRRITRWKRRMDIVESKIATKSNEEREIWKWFKSVLQNLGADGMSSDESDVEAGGGTVLYIKKLPWRRNIDTELGVIDRARGEPLLNFSTKGMRPLTRVHGRDLPSSRNPTRGLKRAFYDDGWIGDHEIESNIPEGDFQWMKVIPEDEAEENDDLEYWDP